VTPGAAVPDGRVPGYLGRVLDGDGAPVGTCFQVSPGVLVTACHVLDDIDAAADDALVRVDPLAGGEAFDAVVVRVDPVRDLAVLAATACLAAVTGPLTATDRVLVRTPVTATGHTVLEDRECTYRFLTAVGQWAGGTTRDDAIQLGRMIADRVVPGMSGAPVVRDGDDAVAGVVSGRYNSADGWPPSTVWIARTEDLLPLLDGITSVPMQQEPPNPLPPVWNVPPRSAVFSGRDELLGQVRQGVKTGSPVAVQALHGLGGVGKTLLAVEFAHRFAGDYDLVWWVNAEQPELVPEQIASLAVAAALVSGDTPIPPAAEAARRHLRGTDRWLLVFDNAEDPVAIRPLLPEGPGHVLITSRNLAWSEVAVPVEIDVFTRPESVQLLTRQATMLTGQEADTIADRLGDLPLAIAQAAGMLAGTNMSAGEYLNALREETEHVLSEGVPATYPVSLAAVVRVATEKVAAVDVAAAQLLRVCASLAPEPVPLGWFTGAASLNRGIFPDQLAAIASSPLALRQCPAVLARHGLARATREGPLLHRLTAAITRDTLSPAEEAVTRAAAEELLVAADPGATADLATWAVWVAILPHLIHLDPATTSNGDLRLLACNATLVLFLRGDSQTGRDLADSLHRAWSASLGEDHPDTLLVANSLARCLYGLGDYSAARALDQDTLARRRRVLGDDHPDTLQSASNLARTLQTMGDNQGARSLQEDALARRRRVLGEDHPDTLHSANRLAVTLHDLGEDQAARTLEEDTLAQMRRVLGDDHPNTLRSASDLAATLHSLGEYQAARTLQEDTLARRRRVLGDDHHNTLHSANRLGVALHDLGEYQAAFTLHEDTVARSRRVLGDDHPDTLRSASDLAATLHSVGEYQAARTLHEDTVARSRRVLGDDHPDTLRSASYLAATLHDLGEYQAARTLYQDTLVRMRRVLGDDHRDTLILASNLAAQRAPTRSLSKRDETGDGDE
jgi:hypothetical protein